MSGIRGKNTRPEVFLRHALHAAGFRYRLNGVKLPGKPDLVFASRKTVVFVHGCFWHAHSCDYFKWPKSNKEFWKAKLTANERRDVHVAEQLRCLGWRVLVVWECELRQSNYTLPNPAVTRIKNQLTAPTDAR